MKFYFNYKKPAKNYKFIARTWDTAEEYSDGKNYELFIFKTLAELEFFLKENQSKNGVIFIRYENGDKMMSGCGYINPVCDKKTIGKYVYGNLRKASPKNWGFDSGIVENGDKL